MKIAMDISIMEECRTGTEEYTEGLVWGLNRVGTQVLGVGRHGQALLPDQTCLGLSPRHKRSPWHKWWWENVGILSSPKDVSLVHIPYMMHPPRPLAVPTVVTVHDLIPYRLQAYHGRLRERLYFGQIRKYLPLASQIVAISQATYRDIADFFPQWIAKVTVIPNGVHPDYFRPVAVEQMEQLTSTYGLVKRPRLLYVGGYDPRKNVQTLLKACQKVFARLNDGELVLVGALNHEPTTRLVTELGMEDRAILTPYLSRRNVVALYQAADLFVYPSTYEGFGLPPAQALAMGIPVIAGDISAVSEVVGDSGLLVPPKEVDAWVDTIIKVIQTPALAQKMAARGRARAEDFSWENIAQQYQKLYHRLVRE
ncbi:glycosyltransferase family 4 protein [Sulfobacillus thermosulfidooxidans]|uniref:glycosyltransferase family 4 protein n=1 Tax=Sulfobacillus thermosulfidooxidans TaxID=28034 RepID=UPI00031F1605|nr:glycosyltransferase family 1 protein [Sulfobacillus thermosulfidooxidans]